MQCRVWTHAEEPGHRAVVRTGGLTRLHKLHRFNSTQDRKTSKINLFCSSVGMGSSESRDLRFLGDVVSMAVATSTRQQRAERAEEELPVSSHNIRSFVLVSIRESVCLSFCLSISFLSRVPCGPHAGL